MPRAVHFVHTPVSVRLRKDIKIRSRKKEILRTTAGCLLFLRLSKVTTTTSRECRLPRVWRVSDNVKTNRVPCGGSPLTRPATYCCHYERNEFQFLHRRLFFSSRDSPEIGPPNPHVEIIQLRPCVHGKSTVRPQDIPRKNEDFVMVQVFVFV